MDNLTLQTAVELASAQEAEDQAKQLRGNPMDMKIQQIHQTANQQGSQCHRCKSTSDTGQTCPYRSAECHKCHKKGHLAKACRTGQCRQATGRTQGSHGSRGKRRSANSHYVQFAAEDDDSTLPIFSMGGENPHSITVAVKYGSKRMSMEVNTGAAISIISEHTYNRLFSDHQLSKPSVKLRTYTEEQIKVIGEIKAEADDEQKSFLPLVVVEGDGPSLMGRNWLKEIRLPWKRIRYVEIANTAKQLQSLLNNFSEVFEDKLGKITRFEASLSLKAGATPKFHKPRNVPIALKEKISKELDRLEAEGILERVNYSDWAAPVVPVPKPDGHIRLCGDYKVTINPALEKIILWQL